MLSSISRHLKEKLKVFFLTDNIVFNNKVIPIDQEHFQEITLTTQHQTIAFIDGGQAEILSGGNLHLSFIRVLALVMKGAEKMSSLKQEFYVLATANYQQGEIWYEGKIFPLDGAPSIDEQDLLICSTDSSIRSGNERAPISKVASMARRFAELKLASRSTADHVLLDGTLEATLKNEEKYLALLGPQVHSLSKTCSLFTTCGNNPAVLLQKLSPFLNCWSYHLDQNSYFVKLHPGARHLFRFKGNSSMLPLLVPTCSDPVFLGYPYGLILADKLARVSNAERNSLQMSFLLRDENREMMDYLNTMNAHDILDHLN